VKRCVAILAVLALLAPARADERNKDKPVVVPFELLKSRHMAVQVKINGKGPYRVVFDTGAPVTLLNNKVAKATGVMGKNFKPPLFAPFGSMGEFKIQELEVGNVKAKNIPTMVMDHPTVTAMADVLGPLEGIVGMSFFGRYRVTIDYQKRELTLVPTEFRPPDLMKKMTAMLLDPNRGKTKVIAPAGVWGFRADKDRGDEAPGVPVKEVYPEGPAARAGLKVGDRLLTLDDRWTDSVADLFTAASLVRPGTTASLRVRRGDEELMLAVRPKEGL
jgi:hypothetical protein